MRLLQTLKNYLHLTSYLLSGISVSVSTLGRSKSLGGKVKYESWAPLKEYLFLGSRISFNFFGCCPMLLSRYFYFAFLVLSKKIVSYWLLHGWKWKFLRDGLISLWGVFGLVNIFRHRSLYLVEIWSFHSSNK